MQQAELIQKFFEEHRIAWDAIASIKRSTDTSEKKAERILTLFETELKPHFKQEEDELFTTDAESIDLINEHKIIYALIDAISKNKEEADIEKFFTIMDAHIKKEDAYFDKINNTNLPTTNNNAIIIAVIIIIVFALVLFLSKTN